MLLQTKGSNRVELSVSDPSDLCPHPMQLLTGILQLLGGSWMTETLHGAPGGAEIAMEQELRGLKWGKRGYRSEPKCSFDIIVYPYFRTSTSDSIHIAGRWQLLRPHADTRCSGLVMLSQNPAYNKQIHIITRGSPWGGRPRF